METMARPNKPLSSGLAQKHTEHAIPVIDSLLPASIANSRNFLYRARILVAMLLTYALLLSFSAVYFWFLTPLSQQIKLQTAVVFIPLVLLFSLLLWLFKRTGAFLVCANICIASVYISVTIGVFVSSGPIDSPASPVVPIAALMAFCLCGRRWGFIWASVVLITHVVMFAMESNGYQFPNVLASDTTNINIIFDWILAYSAMIAMVALYENMQDRLKDERDQEHEKYVYLATHDQLTGIPNRVLFYDRLNNALVRARRDRTQLAILYLDLDGFKPINDKYGHDAGDLMLVEIATRLWQSVRSSDTVARLGGDEFTAILENLSKPEDAEDIARKIAFKINKPMQLLGHEAKVKASIGIAFFPSDGTTSDELIRCADVAMYYAKNHYQSNNPTDMCVSYANIAIKR